jgi:N-acetylmuramoyl-L-alanine amidase CwlA
MSYENPQAMNCSSERSKIDRIVIHHNATTNAEVAMTTWTVENGKNTSAHYEITDTQIIGCVPEDLTAWHAGDWSTNLRSIGLEHLNSSGAPNWCVSENTMKNSAQLIADICQRYNLPINATTIQPHQHFVATACPGGLDVAKLIQMAQEVANGSNTVTAETVLNKGDKKMVIAFNYNGTGYSIVDGVMVAFSEPKYWGAVNQLGSKNGVFADLGKLTKAQYDQFVKAYKFGK